MGNLLGRQAPAQAAGGGAAPALPAPGAAGALQQQQLNNPAAVQDWRPAMDTLTVVISGVTMLGIYQALTMTRGYTPGLVPASVFATVSLFGGAWSATVGREHTIIPLAFLSLSIVAVATAIAGGAEFNYELAVKIFKAIKPMFEEAMR